MKYNIEIAGRTLYPCPSRLNKDSTCESIGCGPVYEKGIGIYVGSKHWDDFSLVFQKKVEKEDHVSLCFYGKVDSDGKDRTHFVLIKETHSDYKELVESLIFDEKHSLNRFKYELKALEVAYSNIERDRRRIKEKEDLIESLELELVN